MAIPFVVCRRRLGRKATLYGLALACPGTGAIPETVLIIVEHCCAGTRRDAWSWYRRQKAVVADDDYSVVAMVERSMRKTQSHTSRGNSLIEWITVLQLGALWSTRRRRGSGGAFCLRDGDT